MVRVYKIQNSNLKKSTEANDCPWGIDKYQLNFFREKRWSIQSPWRRFMGFKERPGPIAANRGRIFLHPRWIFPPLWEHNKNAIVSLIPGRERKRESTYYKYPHFLRDPCNTWGSAGPLDSSARTFMTFAVSPRASRKILEYRPMQHVSSRRSPRSKAFGTLITIGSF